MLATISSQEWQAFAWDPKQFRGWFDSISPHRFAHHFNGLSDARKGQGKRHRLNTIFAIIACAKLSGKAGGHRAIYCYARTLTKPQTETIWLAARRGLNALGAEEFLTLRSSAATKGERTHLPNAEKIPKNPPSNPSRRRRKQPNQPHA